jgi:hypothetical protein
MERPRGEKLVIQRQITGELMYIQDCWENNLQVNEFADLPPFARRAYEEAAATVNEQGGKPSVMAVLEHYDGARSELSRSCEALADELLRSSDGSHEEIWVAMRPHEALERLQNLAVGRVLVGNDVQLADPYREGDGLELDIRKSNSLLTDVSLSVWKHGVNRKCAIVTEPGVEPSYPLDYLPYPTNEDAHQSQIGVAFAYYHPQEGHLSEMIWLYIDEFGNLSVFREMFVSRFGFASSEGAYNESLEDIPEHEIAAFADYIAELVGDGPISMRDREDDSLTHTINRIPDQLSRAYAQEWIDNMSPEHVRALLMGRFDATGSSLLDDLMDPVNTAAREALVELVNGDRAQHVDRCRAGEQAGITIEPWRDRIVRLPE